MYPNKRRWALQECPQKHMHASSEGSLRTTTCMRSHWSAAHNTTGRPDSDSPPGVQLSLIACSSRAMREDRWTSITSWQLAFWMHALVQGPPRFTQIVSARPCAPFSRMSRSPDKTHIQDVAHSSGTRPTPPCRASEVHRLPADSSSAEVGAALHALLHGRLRCGPHPVVLLRVLEALTLFYWRPPGLALTTTGRRAHSKCFGACLHLMPNFLCW